MSRTHPNATQQYCGVKEMSTTMLIVDDSRVTRMMIRNIASELHDDWEYLEAGSGDEALEIVAGHDIDIMTLDLNMPGMDGLELSSKLRVIYPKAQITLMTANIQDAVRKRADEAGIGFIAKPVTQEKIYDYVEGSCI